jgi:sugar/nucleoside kinase (ribokinase family)
MIENMSFIGHISIDTISNINGINVQAGGAALHAAIAAKTLVEKVQLASFVGQDYPFMDVLECFPKKLIKISKLPSTRFTIKYNKSWESSYIKNNWGVGSRISTSTLPLQDLKLNKIIHISPISPSKLIRIVKKIRNITPRTKISVNTWLGYIRGKRNRRLLKSIAEEVDYFIVNDSEVKALTETKSLSTALRKLKTKMLVVTLGEFGAISNAENREIHMIPALKFPLKKIVDTTGAGDVWCGAFLAAYNLSNSFIKSVSAASLISSIKCTGWGVSKLLKLKFKSVDSITEYIIGLKEGSFQKRILDFL